MAKPLAVTDATFTEEVLNSDQPVLVDFWADWCGPCKMVAPVVEELAADYDGRLKVTKVDVDSSPLTAGTYGIRSIPTLLIFKDGKPVNQVVGAVPKQVLQEKIDQVV
ncbi:MAG: thioredoxin [Chloroflexi bacterium]|nr:thioredoxin [Chloroflexota bacterium]